MNLDCTFVKNALGTAECTIRCPNCGAEPDRIQPTKLLEFRKLAWHCSRCGTRAGVSDIVCYLPTAVRCYEQRRDGGTTAAVPTEHPSSGVPECDSDDCYNHMIGSSLG
jgi:hypothetical protein